MPVQLAGGPRVQRTTSAAEGPRDTRTVGATIHGSDACVEAWRGFFESFPDYRNVFHDVAGADDGIVAVRGRSECSFPALDGPAEWRAVVIGDRFDVWQVSEPRTDVH